LWPSGVSHHPNRTVKASSFAVQSRGAAAVKLAAPSKLIRKVLASRFNLVRKIIFFVFCVNQIRSETLCKSVDGCAKVTRDQAQTPGAKGIFVVTSTENCGWTLHRF
jgi:hypothetical protein